MSSAGFSPAFSRRWLAAALLAVFCFLFIRYSDRASSREASDFQVYHASAVRFIHKENIYAPFEANRAGDYKYSPWFTFVISPLACLPLLSAAQVFFAVNFISLIAVFFYSHRLLPKRLMPGSRAWLGLLIIPLLFNGRYILNCLDTGQVNLMLLALVTASVYYAEKSRLRLAGSLLAMAISIKYVPLVLLPYCLYRRQWRFVGWTILFSSVFLVLPVLYLGRPVFEAYYRSWIPFVSQASLDYGQLADSRNQSLFGMCLRFLADKIYFGDSVRVMDLPAHLALKAAAAFGAVLYGLTLKRGRDQTPGGIFPRGDIALMLIFMALFNPNCWSSNYVVLIFPVMWLAFTAVERPALRPVLFLAIAASWFAGNFGSGSLFGEGAKEWMYTISGLTLSALILTAVLLGLKYLPLSKPLGSQPKRNALLAGAVLVYALFYLSLVGRPPLDPIDDGYVMTAAKKASWTLTLRSFFSPDLQAFRGGGYPIYSADGYHSRWGQALVLKGLQAVLGDYMPGYFFFQMLTAAALMLLMGLWIHRLTGSLTWMLLGIALYATSPPFIINTIWLADWMEQMQLVMLLAFGMILAAMKPGPAGKQRSRLIIGAGAAALTFLAMRSRADGYLILIVTGILVLWHYGTSLRKSTLILSAGLIILATAMVPWKVLAEIPQKFHWEQTIQMTFMNPQTVYDGESLPALWDLSLKKPVSLLRLLGFGLGWMAVLSLVWALYKRKSVERPETRLLCVWLGVVCVLFALPENSPRYLTNAWTPLVMLLPVLFQSAASSLAHPRMRRLYGAVVYAACAVTLVLNTVHTVHWRNTMVTANYLQSRMAQIVYNDSNAIYYDNFVSFDTIYSFYPWVSWANKRVGPGFFDLVVCSNNPNYDNPYDEARIREALKTQRRLYSVMLDSSDSCGPGFEFVIEGKAFLSSPLLDWVYRIKPKSRYATYRIERFNPEYFQHQKPEIVRDAV